METGKIRHVKMYCAYVLMDRIFILSCKNQFLIMIDGKLPQEQKESRRKGKKPNRSTKTSNKIRREGRRITATPLCPDFV